MVCFLQKNHSARELLCEIYIDPSCSENFLDISHETFFSGIIRDDHIGYFDLWDSTLSGLRRHNVSHIRISDNIYFLVLETSHIEKLQKSDTIGTRWFNVDFHASMIASNLKNPSFCFLLFALYICLMKVIILENIRSLNNVGSIIRTADGAGFDRVICVGYTPTPPRKEISKTALGAETWIPWEYYEKIEDAIDTYKKADCTIIVLEKNERSVLLANLPPEKGGEVKEGNLGGCERSICIIAGNELEGVSKTAQEMADHICHLPMLGKKESLNVSVAAGIAMYHFCQG